MSRAWIAIAVLIPMLAGCLDDAASDPEPLDVDADLPLAFHADGTAVLLETVPHIVAAQFPIGATAFEPTIGVDGDGGVYVAARYPDLAGERIRATFDDGQSWQDIQPMLAPMVTNPPASGDPFIYVDQATGRVFGAHLTSFFCTWIVFSDDQGATWETNPLGCGVPPGLDDHQSIVAAPSRGTATTYGDDRLIHYCAQNNVLNHCAVSTDGGRTFGPKTLVVIQLPGERPGQCTAASGHVRADPEGRVFFAQVHCGTPVIVMSEDEGASWQTRVISDVHGQGYHMDVAADAAGNLYAFWIADDERPRLAISTDHGQSWGPALDVAPPEVVDSSFPTIDAAAEGHIAFGYYGQAERVPGETAWHAYIGASLESLDTNPAIYTMAANPAGDPIARQCSGRCGGAGDFLDITIAPDGRPWMSMTDICYGACPDGGPDQSPNQAAAATWLRGPSLHDTGPLRPLASP